VLGLQGKAKSRATTKDVEMPNFSFAFFTIKLSVKPQIPDIFNDTFIFSEDIILFELSVPWLEINHLLIALARQKLPTNLFNLSSIESLVAARDIKYYC